MSMPSHERIRPLIPTINVISFYGKTGITGKAKKEKRKQVNLRIEAFLQAGYDMDERENQNFEKQNEPAINKEQRPIPQQQKRIVYA
ncbi:18693_t:CDS:1, partial [Racocetra persica]